MLASFLRHAEAEDRAKSDFDRRLTSKGFEQSVRVGKFLARSRLIPDLILTSPVVRARQTAEIVGSSLGVEIIEAPWMACGMEPEDCIRGIETHSGKEHVLLVGHEPDFSQVIGHFLGLTDPSVLKIRKASLTAIELADFHSACGLLHFSIPVRLMMP